MWRVQTSKKGWHILNSVRQLAAETPPLRMPQPPPKSNIFRLFKILGISLPVATSGLLGYAWYDQDFRHILFLNVPYAKDLLGNILPESDEIPPVPSFQKPSVLSTIEKTPLIENVSNSVQESSFQTVSIEKASAGPSKSDKVDVIVENQLKKRLEDDKADNTALESMITKILVNGPSLVAEAVRAQTEAVTKIHNHSILLKQILDETTNTPDKDAKLEVLAIAQKEKEQALDEANQRVSKAKKFVEKLQDVIDQGKANQVTQNNPIIVEASRQLNEFLKDLGSINLQLRQAETEATVIVKYRDLVEKGRQLFQKEIESLVPATKHGSETKLMEDDLNLLIAHAYRRIEQLQSQITLLEAQEKQKLTTALELQRKGNTRVTEDTIKEDRQKFVEELKAEKSKLEVEYLVKLETEVRKQLARQAAAHNDHLKEALEHQQIVLDKEFDQVLQLKIIEEKENFQAEVMGWISKLRGFEAAIDGRAASEKLARGAQNLWLACIALASIVNYGGEGESLQPLRKSVDTILKASNSDPFVQSIVNNFPEVALDRGVSTKEQLKNRFYKVSVICRRLGLVSTNPSLYNYFLSYLHSLFSLDNVVATSETEEVDLNALNTFDLLAYAKYWMDRGNLELAMRFMVQLTGESRRAANDWINEARLFLETTQTIQTLTAFASANGLVNTF